MLAMREDGMGVECFGCWEKGKEGTYAKPALTAFIVFLLPAVVSSLELSVVLGHADAFGTDIRDEEEGDCD